MRKVAVTAVLCIFAFLLFLHPVNSGDFFHHIATGRDILTTWSLPKIDTWTFTATGKPWTAHSWGSGVIYYLIHQATGYTGISIFFSLIGVATTLALYQVSKNIPVTALTAALISLRWPSRPEVMAPFFLSVCMLMVPHLTHPKKSYLIPLFFWAWSIVYGSSVIFGIVILGIYVVTKKSFTKRTLWILFLSVAAANANGYGFTSFLYIFMIPNIAGHVGEWLPVWTALNPMQPGVALFYQYPVLCYGVFSVIVLLAIVWPKKIRTHLYPLALSLGVILPYVSVRFLNVGPVLVLPLLTSVVTRMNKTAQRIAIICIILLAIGATIIRFRMYPLAVGLEPLPYASSSLLFLKKKGLTGNIFAPQELGGYIRWIAPDSRIFYDTRDDLYIGSNVVSDLDAVTQGTLEMLSLLDSWKADIVIAEADHELFTPLLYHAAWSLVHVGDSSFVVVRSPLAASLRLPVYTHLDPTRAPPIKNGKISASAQTEMARVLENDPSPENTIRMAEILLALGNKKDAASLVASLTIPTFGGMQEPITLLGFAEVQARFYLSLGACEQAKHALNRGERINIRPFIFYPKHRLLSSLNLYWGQYYKDCENNVTKAREYYLLYAAQTTSSRERRGIEQLLDSLQISPD